jgi:recombination protein RecA
MATNKQRAADKAKQATLEADPDYVKPVKEKDTTKLVEAAIKAIAKDGCTFTRMVDKSKELRPVLPTGIFGLDHYIIGSGGFPRGRIVELFGIESGGKGTLLSQLIGNIQRLDPKAEIAYVDAECAFDHAYAQKLGVDTDKLLIAEPNHGEEALQAAIDITVTGGIRLVAIDSVAALVPLAELSGEVSDQHMGLQAAMMGRALRKMLAATSKTGTCVVFLNQLRDSMNTGFGAKTVTPGGKALKFFSSLRLSVARIQNYKERGETVGAVTKVAAPKNKTHQPKLEMDINLMHDMPAQKPGFDNHMSLVDLALTNAIWIQEGSKYTLPSTSEVVTGKANLRDALRDNKELRKITERATLEAMGKTELYIKRSMRG